MAIAKVQTVSGSATSGNTVTLGSWTPAANDLVLLCVNMYNASITPVVSGNGLTWVLVASAGQTRIGRKHFLYRAMKSTAPSAGQITVTVTGNTMPVIAVATRFSGVDTSGTNGSGAVEAYAVAPGPSADNDDMICDITTLTANAWAVGFGAHRNDQFTVPAGETAISINNYAGDGGDTVSISEWYQAQASPGSISLGAANDLNDASAWCVLAVSLKPVSLSVTVAPAAAAAKIGVVVPGVVYGSLSISPLFSSVGSGIVNPVVDIASLPVTVLPGVASAAVSVADPTILQSDADITPSPAAAGSAVSGPGVMLGIPVSPAGPAWCVADRVNPELTFTSISFAPETPASAAVSSIVPTVRVVNVTVVPMTLTSRPKMDWTILPRPAVYLDDQILLEDQTGSWLFEDSTHIISGLGRGAQLVLPARSGNWHLNKRYGNNG